MEYALLRDWAAFHVQAARMTGACASPDAYGELPDQAACVYDWEKATTEISATIHGICKHWAAQPRLWRF